MDARILVAFALVPLLAGCAGYACQAQAPVSARGIGPSTPSSGGDGAYPAVVAVTQEPGGPPLAGAGVVFFWGDAAPDGQAAAPSVHVSAGAGGSGVQVGAAGSTPPHYTTTLPLRTGADGTVQARLPVNRIVGVVAAADGWTEEWVPHLATGAQGSGGQLSVTLPLYRTHLAIDLSGTTDRAGASLAFLIGDGNAQWYPEDVHLGKAPGAAAGYLARLAHLHATLNWTNGPTGFGDLALAAGPAQGRPTVVRDDSADVAVGGRMQAMDLSEGTLRSAHLEDSGALLLGPATRSGFAGVNGIPYTLHIDLEMAPSSAFPDGCGRVSVNVSADANGGGWT